MAVRLVCVLAAALCCALAAAASSAPVGGRAQVLEEQGGTSAGEGASQPNVTWESLKNMLTDTEGNVKTARSLLTSANTDFQSCGRQSAIVGDDRKKSASQACDEAQSAISKATTILEGVQQSYRANKNKCNEWEDKNCFDSFNESTREMWRHQFQNFVTASQEAKGPAWAASTAAAAAKKAVEDALKSNGADDVVSGGSSAGHGAAGARDEAATAAVGQTSGAHDAQGTAASGTSERAGGSITGGDKHTGKAGGVTGTTAAPMQPLPMSLSALFHDVDGGVVPGGVRELLLVAASLALAVV